MRTCRVVATCKARLRSGRSARAGRTVVPAAIDSCERKYQTSTDLHRRHPCHTQDPRAAVAPHPPHRPPGSRLQRDLPVQLPGPGVTAGNSWRCSAPASPSALPSAPAPHCSPHRAPEPRRAPCFVPGLGAWAAPLPGGVATRGTICATRFATSSARSIAARPDAPLSVISDAKCNSTPRSTEIGVER